MKALNLGLAFLLELCMLAAILYWALELHASTGVRWVVALGGVASVAVTWSLIAAPRAKRRLPRTPLLVFKLAIFTVSAVLLYSAGQQALAIVFELLVLANLALGVAWNQA